MATHQMKDGIETNKNKSMTTQRSTLRTNTFKASTVNISLLQDVSLQLQVYMTGEKENV